VNRQTHSIGIPPLPGLNPLDYLSPKAMSLGAAESQSRLFAIELAQATLSQAESDAIRSGDSVSTITTGGIRRVVSRGSSLYEAAHDVWLSRQGGVFGLSSIPVADPDQVVLLLPPVIVPVAPLPPVVPPSVVPYVPPPPKDIKAGRQIRNGLGMSEKFLVFIQMPVMVWTDKPHAVQNVLTGAYNPPVVINDTVTVDDTAADISEIYILESTHIVDDVIFIHDAEVPSFSRPVDLSFYLGSDIYTRDQVLPILTTTSHIRGHSRVSVLGGLELTRVYDDIVRVLAKSHGYLEVQATNPDFDNPDPSWFRLTRNSDGDLIWHDPATGMDHDRYYPHGTNKLDLTLTIFRLGDLYNYDGRLARSIDPSIVI
jgi:hypothetical protein